MSEKFDHLPVDYVASFEFVHPKDNIEAMTAQRENYENKKSTIWTLENEIRPSDLYCYLGARFGPPNGLLTLLRNDDSNNLIHWDWNLKTSAGSITISGLNFRTDVWISGVSLEDSEKTEFIRQIQADFTNYGKEMAHIRKSHLEPWIEFVNPYQRLKRAVKQLIGELDGLELDPSADALPSLLDSENLEAASQQWKDTASIYSKAIGLSFGIRSMVLVMAESFVNLMYFILVRESIKKDKQLFDGIFRLPMHVRIRSLPYFCAGFSSAVDSGHQSVRDYLQLIDTRNDLLHGNIDIEKLKFNELYFYGKVPIFNQYSTMWERSLGVAYRAVGLNEVHAELAVVDAFVEYLLSLLQDDVRKNVKFISDKFDLGIRKDTGRLGVLFGDMLVDCGIPKDQPDEGGKTLRVAVIQDGPNDISDGEESPGDTPNDTDEGAT